MNKQFIWIWLNMDGKPFHPNCWTDDRRMKVLFAPLRTRSVNPENYDSVIQFWRELIVKYCETVSGHPKVTITGLRTAFARDGQRPHCLQEVLQVLERTGHVKRKDLFMEEPDSSWTKWTVNLMKKPLLWSLQQVKQKILPPSADEEVSYIVLEVVNVSFWEHFYRIFNKIAILLESSRKTARKPQKSNTESSRCEKTIEGSGYIRGCAAICTPRALLQATGSHPVNWWRSHRRQNTPQIWNSNE